MAWRAPPLVIKRTPRVRLPHPHPHRPSPEYLVSSVIFTNSLTYHCEPLMGVEIRSYLKQRKKEYQFVSRTPPSPPRTEESFQAWTPYRARLATLVSSGDQGSALNTDAWGVCPTQKSPRLLSFPGFGLPEEIPRERPEDSSRETAESHTYWGET